MAGEDKDDSPEEFEEALEQDEAEDGPLTSADFHTIAQKQILNAVFAVLADTKMDWALVATVVPILTAPIAPPPASARIAAIPATAASS